MSLEKSNFLTKIPSFIVKIPPKETPGRWNGAHKYHSPCIKPIHVISKEYYVAALHNLVLGAILFCWNLINANLRFCVVRWMRIYVPIVSCRMMTKIEYFSHVAINERQFLSRMALYMKLILTTAVRCSYNFVIVSKIFTTDTKVRSTDRTVLFLFPIVFDILP